MAWSRTGAETSCPLAALPPSPRAQSRGKQGAPTAPVPAVPASSSPKGRLLWARPQARPHPLPYLSPLARNPPSSCQFTRAQCHPHGGREGAGPHLLHFFYLGTILHKVTSVDLVFHCWHPDCFLSLLPSHTGGRSLKSRPFRARESRGCSHSWNPAPKCQLQLHICLTVCPCRHCNPRKPQTTNQV